MKKTERQRGQYRQLLLAQRGQTQEQEDSTGRIWHRIRFYVCLCLFAAYLLLDYTGIQVASWNSEKICREVTKDDSGQLHRELEQVLSRAASMIRISDNTKDF